MMELKKGLDGVATPARDAIQWFVENESDRELDEDAVSQWEEWCAHVWNNAAYAEIVRMSLQISLLSAPTVVSREDLLGDFLAGDGLESCPPRGL